MKWFLLLSGGYLLVALALGGPAWWWAERMPSSGARRFARSLIVSFFVAPSVLLAGHGLMPAPASVALVVSLDLFFRGRGTDWLTLGVFGTGIVPILLVGLLLWGALEIWTKLRG